MNGYRSAERTRRQRFVRDACVSIMVGLRKGDVAIAVHRFNSHPMLANWRIIARPVVVFQMEHSARSQLSGIQAIVGPTSRRQVAADVAEAIATTTAVIVSVVGIAATMRVGPHFSVFSGESRNSKRNTKNERD